MSELDWRRFEKRLVAAHVAADPPLSPEIWHGVEAAIVARPRRSIWLALSALVVIAAALVLALMPSRAPAPIPNPVPTPVPTPNPAPTPAPVPNPVPLPNPNPVPPPEPVVLNAVLQTRRPITFAISSDAARIELEPCRGRFVNVTVLGGPAAALSLAEIDGGRRVEPRFDGGAVLHGGVAHILVPADTHLIVTSSAGPVVVRGLGGPMSIVTEGGDVRVDTSSHLDPRVTVTTDTGAVIWSGRCGSACRVDARSRAGDITLRAQHRAAFTRGAATARSATGLVSQEELTCTDPQCTSSPLPWRQAAPGKGH